MDDFQIRNIDSVYPELEKELSRLFIEMYIEMRESGLMLDLTDNGSAIWLKSLKNTLGRFTKLFVVFEDAVPVGFASGSLAIINDYLGSKKIGVVNHIYVLKKFRNHQLASKMLKKLEDWFKEKEVHSIELQVLYLNKGAIEFWEKMNYSTELLQMRKFIGEK